MCDNDVFIKSFAIYMYVDCMVYAKTKKSPFFVLKLMSQKKKIFDGRQSNCFLLIHQLGLAIK